MNELDSYLLLTLEAALVLFAIFAGWRDAGIRRAERASGVIPEVQRGEKSMRALYASFVVAVGAVLFLVTTVAGGAAHVVALMLVNVFSLAYLFFFSTWFRNQVFFPLKRRIGRD